MRRFSFMLVGLLVLALPVVLFVVQNQHLTTDLGLNLGVWAGVTVDPLPVVYLLLGTTFSGLFLGLIVGAIRSSGLKRKVRQLEAEITLQAVQGRD
jgi:uncharacterized integral membrane protein